MSLLLDALKKAAEAKSRNDNTPASDNDPPPQPPSEPAAPPPPPARPPVSREPEPEPEPREYARAPSRYDPDPEDNPEHDDTFDDTHNDTMGQRFSQYDEFDETQQLTGDFGEKTTSSYGSQKHAETVFASKSVQKPLRRGIPIFRFLGFLLLIFAGAAASFYYVQERDFDLQRQLTNIRRQAPIVPLQTSEELGVVEDEAAAAPEPETQVATLTTIDETATILSTQSETDPLVDATEGSALVPATNESLDATSAAVANESSAALNETNSILEPESTDLLDVEQPVVEQQDDLVAETESSTGDALELATAEVTSDSVELETVTPQVEPAETSLPQSSTPESEDAAPVEVVDSSSAEIESQDTPSSSGISVSRTADESEASGELSISQKRHQFEADIRVRDAYAAYQAGQFDEAKALYEDALAIDAKHRDALLGRAAIHLHENQSRAAIEIYRELLNRNPRDHAALGGLNSLAQDENVQRYESDLRFLLKDTPESAPLNYALGTLLSRQKRWADAQQHFFTAYTRDSENPDIAFNLAVSLDNLGKDAPAAHYYKVALKLAQSRASSFDKVQVHRRLQVLEF